MTGDMPLLIRDGRQAALNGRMRSEDGFSIRESVKAADVAVWSIFVGFGVWELGLYQRIESFGVDSSLYIGLARSLVENGSYEFNFKPHTVVPPGLPAIFALMSMVFGSSYAVFVRSMAVFGTLGLVTAYQLLRPEQGRATAAAGCLLLA